jgi:hypothetical protein
MLVPRSPARSSNVVRKPSGCAVSGTVAYAIDHSGNRRSVVVSLSRTRIDSCRGSCSMASIRSRTASSGPSRTWRKRPSRYRSMPVRSTRALSARLCCRSDARRASSNGAVARLE